MSVTRINGGRNLPCFSESVSRRQRRAALSANQLCGKQSNAEKRGQRISAKKRDQSSLAEEKPANFRLENKIFRAGFRVSTCCIPQNVHAAEAPEEFLVD